MSDYEMKVNGELVKLSDIAKGEIKKDNLDEKNKTIFDKIQKYVKNVNAEACDNDDGTLSQSELSIFFDAVENRAKRHNSKNLGRREARGLRKDLNSVLTDNDKFEKSDLKRKDVLAFIQEIINLQKKEPDGTQETTNTPVIQEKVAEDIVDEEDEDVTPIVQQPTTPKTATPRQKTTVVQLGEKAEDLAPKLGYDSVQEMQQANPQAFSKNGKYLLAGAEVKSKEGATIEDSALEGRQTKQEVEQAYTARQAAVRDKSHLEGADPQGDPSGVATRKNQPKPVKPDFWKNNDTKTKQWEEAHILWKNGTSAEAIARTLYNQEGIKATAQQIQERAKAIEKAHSKNFKNGKLVNSKPLLFRTTKAVADKYNAKYNYQKAKTLAKDFYKIADDESGYSSTNKMLKFVKEKINKDNVVDFLTAYNSPEVRKGDSSIIDTIYSEGYNAVHGKINGDTAKELFKVLYIKAQEINAPNRKKFWEQFNKAHIRKDVAKMENAMNGLVGLIKATQSKVKVNGGERQSFAANYNSSINDEKEGLVASYNAARDKDAWYAQVGDKVLYAVTFGNTKTTGDMEKELGAHAKEVRELQALATQIDPKDPQTIKAFEDKYEKIFHVKFNAKAVAATEDTQMRLIEYNQNKVFLSTANKLLAQINNGNSIGTFLAGSDDKAPQECRTALYNALKESLKAKGIDINSATPEQLKKAINDFKQGINSTNNQLLDGKTEEQLMNDLEFYQQATYGSTNIGKTVAKFNENMMKTELGTEIAMEILATIALSYIPGAGEAAAAKLATSCARLGRNATRMARFYTAVSNGSMKTAKAFRVIKNAQRGNAIRSSVNAANKSKTVTRTINATNKAIKYATHAGNAYVATAAVDLSGGKEWEYAHNKAKWMAFFAGGGAVMSDIAPIIAKACHISSEYAEGLIADFMNSGMAAGVTAIENIGNDEQAQQAWVNALTAFILGRVTRGVAAAAKGKVKTKAQTGEVKPKVEVELPDGIKNRKSNPDLGTMSNEEFNSFRNEINKALNDPKLTPAQRKALADKIKVEIENSNANKAFKADLNSAVDKALKAQPTPAPQPEVEVELPDGIKNRYRNPDLQTMSNEEFNSFRNEINKALNDPKLTPAQRQALAEKIKVEIENSNANKAFKADLNSAVDKALATKPSPVPQPKVEIEMPEGLKAFETPKSANMTAEEFSKFRNEINKALNNPNLSAAEREALAEKIKATIQKSNAPQGWKNDLDGVVDKALKSNPAPQPKTSGSEEGPAAEPKGTSDISTGKLDPLNRIKNSDIRKILGKTDGKAITADEAYQVRKEIRNILSDSSLSNAEKEALLSDINKSLKRHIGKTEVGIDHATELRHHINDAVKKLQKPPVEAAPKPAETEAPKPTGKVEPAPSEVNEEFNSFFEKSQFKRTTSQTPKQLGGRKIQQLEKEINQMLAKAKGEADLAQIEAGLNRIRTNPDWVKNMKAKVNARRAELQKPPVEPAPQNEAPKPKAEPKPTNEQGKTALEILSDTQHQITTEEVSIIRNEIENLSNNAELSIEQKRLHLGRLYRGLAAQRQQTAEIVQLRAQIGDQMKKLKPAPVEVTAPSAEAPQPTGNAKPSRFARVRQAASNYWTKASNGVKNLVNKLRSGKSAMQKDTGIKPAGDKTIKELMDGYKKYANKNGYDLKVTPNADGTTTVDFINSPTIKRQIKFGKDGKLIDDAIWVQNKSGKFDGMHYDAKGNLQGFDTLIELSDGRSLSIKVQKGQEKVVVYEYAPGENFANGTEMTPSQFQAKYGRTFPHSELLKNPAAEAPAGAKPADTPSETNPVTPEGSVILEGRYTQITTRENKILRIGDSFKRDALCPEGQSYTTYEMGADGTNYRVELTNIGDGYVQVQDITPSPFTGGGTIIIGGGNPPSMGV